MAWECLHDIQVMSRLFIIFLVFIYSSQYFVYLLLSSLAFLQVLNEFRAPEGENAAHYDAATDGQLMAILELRQDDSLAEEGLCLEVVNRVQRLGKKAGLVPDDSDIVYLGFRSRLKSALESQVC